MLPDIVGARCSRGSSGLRTLEPSATGWAGVTCAHRARNRRMDWRRGVDGEVRRRSWRSSRRMVRKWRSGLRISTGECGGALRSQEKGHRALEMGGASMQRGRHRGSATSCGRRSRTGRCRGRSREQRARGSSRRRGREQRGRSGGTTMRWCARGDGGRRRSTGGR